MARQISTCDEPYMDETDSWLHHLESMGRKERTLHTHRNNVRRCLETMAADGRSTRAEDITTDDILFLWRTLGVKEAVRRAYLRSLSCMVRHHTGRDVLKDANLLHNRESRDRVFIGKDDFAAVYSAADPRQRVILCLGAYMGLRRSEIASIRDGDLRDGRLEVHGKGHGDDGMVVVVPVPLNVMRAIEEYRGSPMKDGPRSDDHLVQNRDHRGILHGMHPSRISETIRCLGDSCGVPITVHSLRRFFATTLYYETGCDIQTIRGMMRHADAGTTLRCYVEPYKEREDLARRDLEEFLGALVSGRSGPPRPYVKDPMVTDEDVRVDPDGVQHGQHLVVPHDGHPVLLAHRIDPGVVAGSVPQLRADGEHPSGREDARDLRQPPAEVRPEEVRLHRRDHVEGAVVERKVVHRCQAEPQGPV